MIRLPGAFLVAIAFALGVHAGDMAPDLRRGLVAAEEGRLEEALSYLRSAAQADGSNAAAQVALGMVALRDRRVDEARGALERARVLSPDLPVVHFGLALLAEKERRFADARDAWERFARLVTDPAQQDMARRHLERLR
jgi:tetratricopeptide (TPR) repeat protein